MKIEKVDAHHHLWTLASPHYAVMAAPSAERYYGNTGDLKFDFGAAELAPLMAAQNVTRTVHVEAHYHPAVEETAHLDAIAKAAGLPHAILGRADLASPALGGELDVHQCSPRFRGLRIAVNWDADPAYSSTPHDCLLADPAFRRGYAELGRRGLLAEVLAMPAQLGDLAALAEAHPQTPLIIGHTGLPFRRTPEEGRAWRSGMARLAALPHVVCKISGLGMADHRWTTASIRPLVEEIIALFGPDRCMFGTNFPVDGLHASYDRIWDAFDEITAGLGDGDRVSLFRDTAMRVFGLA